MKAGEFALVDNDGFVVTGLKNIAKANKELKALKKDKNVQIAGRLTMVKVVASYDNFMAGNQEYLGADGLPIAD